MLVRHVPAGLFWHPADDGLAGTSVYGVHSEDLLALEPFSVKFDHVDFDEFLFATGDMKIWLRAPSSSVYGTYVNKKRQVTCSSKSPLAYYAAAWCNQQQVEGSDAVQGQTAATKGAVTVSGSSVAGAKGDGNVNGNVPGDGSGAAAAQPSFQPGLWVSTVDHSEAITTGQIVYGENSFKGPHASTVLPIHAGANVFIRKSGMFKTDQLCCGIEHSLAFYSHAASRLWWDLCISVVPPRMCYP